MRILSIAYCGGVSPQVFIGGRLYLSFQQPNLVQKLSAAPDQYHCNLGGGDGFLWCNLPVLPTLIWRAKVERLNPLVLLDAGVLFGAVVRSSVALAIRSMRYHGYPSTLPWSTV